MRIVSCFLLRFGLGTLLTALALSIVGLPQDAAAEPPSEETLREGLYLTARQGYEFDIVEDMLNGIWKFDPLTAVFVRTRPFYATTQWWESPDQFHGDAGNLVFSGDKLVYQSWPNQTLFDVFSWRMVNRIPTPNPDPSLGWTLQGPVVSAGETGTTGLVPGTYGFAQCLLDDITNVHHVGPRLCEPLQLPGELGFIGSSDGRDLFSSETWPADLGDLFYHREFSEMWAPESHTLSFDQGRGGFWRADDEGTSFFPAGEGVIGNETIRLDFNFEPFTGPYGVVMASYFHPNSDRLYTFGLRLKPESPFHEEMFFFEIDPVTGDKTDFELPDLSRPEHIDFFPVSLTSFVESPSSYQQLLPIIAETPGLRGTYWMTDLWIYNPSREGVTVEVSRITTPDETSAIEIPAFGSQRITNALVWVGGGAEGDGTTHDALRFVSDYRWGEQLVVSGRIWTVDPVTGGTYGHAVAAVPYPWGYSNHGSYSREDDELDQVLSAGNAVAHFDLDLRESGRFRHNMGLVNSTGEDLSIDVLWGFNESAYKSYEDHHPNGWRQTVIVESHSVKILNLKDIFSPEITEVWPPRIGLVGQEALPIWFSMVDETTGDATFVPYSNFHHESRSAWWEGNLDPFYRLALPVAAHTKGRNGSRWVTDLIGFLGDTGGGTADHVYPFFHPADLDEACGGNLPVQGIYEHSVPGVFPSDLDAWIEEKSSFSNCSMEVCATPGWRTIFPDIIHSFEECAADDDVFGGLELVTGSWFSGFSRTYTTRPDGGTYGSMLPLYPPGGWPVQHFAGLELSEATRINLGFFNGDHDHAITHRVSLYSADGSLTAEREFVLESLGSKLESIQDFFGQAIPGGTYGLTVMPLDDPDAGVEGRSWAYVSVIDQLTNDPINLW